VPLPAPRGGVPKGFSSHFFKSLWVNRFKRSMEASLDNDHFAFERWCSHFSSSIAIKAVQI